MYHIGQDKRQLQSAGLICEGFTRLIQTRKYHGISITLIAQESRVGRATFYRLFDDKADVIVYLMEQVFDGMIQHLSPESTADDVLRELYDECLKRRAMFLALMEAGMYEYMQTKLAVLVEEKLSFVRAAKRMNTHDWRYFVHVRAGMMFAALRVLMTHYPEDSADDIIRTTNSFFGSGHRVPNPKNAEPG